MSLFSVLKRNARLALRNMWGKSIGVLFIYVGATCVLSILQGIATNIFGAPLSIDPVFALRYGVDEKFFQSFMATSPIQMIVPVVFVILYVLLLAPLSLGAVRFHNELVRGRNPGVSEVFHFFENAAVYRRAIWYDISLTVRCLLWAIPFYVVPCGIFGVSLFTLMRVAESATRQAVAMASLGILLACLLFLLATAFYIATVNRYVLAAYLLCMDDTMTVGDAIKQSVNYTKGYRFGFLLFELSFIGWGLLCFFVIPVFYVVPYLRTATAMYARYIIEKNTFVPAEATKEFVVENPSQLAATQPAPPTAQPASRENPFDSFRQTQVVEPPVEEPEELDIAKQAPTETNEPE